MSRSGPATAGSDCFFSGERPLESPDSLRTPDNGTLKPVDDDQLA